MAQAWLKVVETPGPGSGYFVGSVDDIPEPGPGVGSGCWDTISSQRLFEAALGALAEFYSHPRTLVLKATTLPEGYPDVFAFPEDCAPKEAAYYEQGWCHCESSVAALSKSSGIVLDLGQLAASAPAGGPYPVSFLHRRV